MDGTIAQPLLLRRMADAIARQADAVRDFHAMALAAAGAGGDVGDAQQIDAVSQHLDALADTLARLAERPSSELVPLDVVVAPIRLSSLRSALAGGSAVDGQDEAGAFELL